MDLRDKRVVVVGLARSGLECALFAAKRGAHVIVTDAAPASKLHSNIEKLDGCATLELGGHRIESFVEADLVVMSPGVPFLKECTLAREKGVEVIAEIELAYRFVHPLAQLIAITGTNGKSTVTSLSGAICDASGAPTFCGGNLGEPLICAIDHPANSEGGILVAEVAGFMLETCNSFAPRIGVGLNISPDHLDRYGEYEVYASMKNRIFQWLKNDQFAVYNADDERVKQAALSSEGRSYGFSSSKEMERGAFFRDGSIVLRFQEEGLPSEECISLESFQLVGKHNVENMMAAFLATRLAGIETQALIKATSEYRALSHRMQLVGDFGGVRFYNDSKGTNVGAVAASLSGFPRKTVLIAGGVDKGGDYQPMIEAFEPCARALVLIGEAAPIIEGAFQRANFSCPIIRAKNMDDAVAQSVRLAQPGDAVVLSPACSSYDMFRNFEERGDAFSEAVRNSFKK